MGFNVCSKPKDTPALANKILHKDVNSPKFETTMRIQESAKSTQFPREINKAGLGVCSMQCTNVQGLRPIPGQATSKPCCRWSISNKFREKGMTMTPNTAPVELWCDADFCKNWNPVMAWQNPFFGVLLYIKVAYFINMDQRSAALSFQ